MRNHLIILLCLFSLFGCKEEHQKLAHSTSLARPVSVNAKSDSLSKKVVTSVDASTRAGAVSNGIMHLRTAFDDKLLDYRSARFKDVRLYYSTEKSPIVACGGVNAKNRMGGYTGWARFIYLEKDNELDIEPGSDASDAEAKVKLIVFNLMDNLMCGAHHYKTRPVMDGCDYSAAISFLRSPVKLDECIDLFLMDKHKYETAISGDDAEALKSVYVEFIDACGQAGELRSKDYCDWTKNISEKLKSIGICLESENSATWASCPE